MAFCGQCGTKSSGGAFCTECGAAVGSKGPEVEGRSASKGAGKVSKTQPSAQVAILAELWVNRKMEEFEDFVEYNDLGLPLAYAISYQIVETTELAEKFIGETWNLLLEAYGIEDTGFETLDEVFGVWEADGFKADD